MFFMFGVTGLFLFSLPLLSTIECPEAGLVGEGTHIVAFQEALGSLLLAMGFPTLLVLLTIVLIESCEVSTDARNAERVRVLERNARFLVSSTASDRSDNDNDDWKINENKNISL